MNVRLIEKDGSTIDDLTIDEALEKPPEIIMRSGGEDKSVRFFKMVQLGEPVVYAPVEKVVIL